MILKQKSSNTTFIFESLVEEVNDMMISYFVRVIIRICNAILILLFVNLVWVLAIVQIQFKGKLQKYRQKTYQFKIPYYMLSIKAILND